MEVHSALGNGFMEVIYQRSLEYELKLQNIPFAREVEMPVYYKEFYWKLCGLYFSYALIAIPIESSPGVSADKKKNQIRQKTSIEPRRHEAPDKQINTLRELFVSSWLRGKMEGLVSIKSYLSIRCPPL